MKILHIAPEWKWSEIFILPIAIEQAKKGEEVWLSTPNPDESSNLIESINIVAWNKKYNKIFSYISSLFLIMYMVRKLKITHVYAHTTIDSSLYILTLRIFTSVNICYINHGVPYIGYQGVMKCILMVLEFININFSHNILTITFSMVDFLEKLNITGKVIKTFEPGTLVGMKFMFDNYLDLLCERSVEDKIFNDKIRIIYVGRIEKRKGLYDLINAINLTNLDCELSILGGEADDLDIYYDQEKIRFLGYKKDLSQYYLKSDILCVPSYHEGFGQVYLEAASFGVIPICCNIPGPTDFIKHGENGFVVEPQSTTSILDLLSEIGQKKFNLDTMSEYTFSIAKNYESSLVIKKNMELL